MSKSFPNSLLLARIVPLVILPRPEWVSIVFWIDPQDEAPHVAQLHHLRGVHGIGLLVAAALGTRAAARAEIDACAAGARR